MHRRLIWQQRAPSTPGAAAAAAAGEGTVGKHAGDINGGAASLGTAGAGNTTGAVPGTPAWRTWDCQGAGVWSY